MTPEDRPIPSEVRAQFGEYFESPRANGHYRNPWGHPALPTGRDVLRWKTSPNDQRVKGYRARSLSVPSTGLADFEALVGYPTRLFWIGHASFLCELDGTRFVIDPIFGRAGGVVKRVTPPAAMPDQLTDISAVLVTHGHHDHLDPASLQKLAQAQKGRAVFVVPRGLASVLPRECTPAIELDWWQFVQIGAVRVHLVPAQHWHRRGAFDTNKSLWGGYVIEGTHRVYHTGDTGYFGGFEAIGRVFDGIDVACLPLGAYEPRWFMSAQHMSPEQSLQAQVDLNATHFVGMHWGTYDLSNEPIEAGPVLVQRVAAERGIGPDRLHVIEPGGSVALAGARGQTRAEVRHRYAM
ncbi:MAG TPA: MBL fold metallo-hydrolase [Polyangiales bacterium]|nr:MBL fold metallo-hydrolase [Polyangiales bacterium]